MIFGSDDFFGRMFDFDGDSKTDMLEAFMGLQILEDLYRENDRDKDAVPEKDKEPEKEKEKNKNR